MSAASQFDRFHHQFIFMSRRPPNGLDSDVSFDTIHVCCMSQHASYIVFIAQKFIHLSHGLGGQVGGCDGHSVSLPAYPAIHTLPFTLQWGKQGRIVAVDCSYIKFVYDSQLLIQWQGQIPNHHSQQLAFSNRVQKCPEIIKQYQTHHPNPSNLPLKENFMVLGKFPEVAALHLHV